jgi:hypothetical protein
MATISFLQHFVVTVIASFVIVIVVIIIMIMIMIIIIIIIIETSSLSNVY